MGRRAKSIEAVRLVDLISDRPVITDATFTGKIIQGPAVVSPWECIFEGCEWSSDFTSTFWPTNADRPIVIGAIALERCTFVDCVFVGVGITAPETDRDKYSALWQ